MLFKSQFWFGVLTGLAAIGFVTVLSGDLQKIVHFKNEFAEIVFMSISFLLMIIGGMMAFSKDHEQESSHS
jgi:hypothetical protein